MRLRAGTGAGRSFVSHPENASGKLSRLFRYRCPTALSGRGWTFVVSAHDVFLSRARSQRCRWSITKSPGQLSSHQARSVMQARSGLHEPARIRYPCPSELVAAYLPAPCPAKAQRRAVGDRGRQPVPAGDSGERISRRITLPPRRAAAIAAPRETASQGLDEVAAGPRDFAIPEGPGVGDHCLNPRSQYASGAFAKRRRRKLSA